MGQTLGGGRSNGYMSIRDMVDGGGAGASGSEFQGGGALSMVANALADPLGSRDRQTSMGDTRPMMRPMQPQPMPQPQPQRPMARPMPAQPTQNPHPPMLPPMQGPQPMPPMQGPQARPQVTAQSVADWAVSQYPPQVLERAAEDPAVLQSLMKQYLASQGGQ